MKPRTTIVGAEVEGLDIVSLEGGAVLHRPPSSDHIPSIKVVVHEMALRRARDKAEAVLARVRGRR